MAANMNFTDKTYESLTAAIQLAKDYANAQGMSLVIYTIGGSILMTTLLSSSCAHRFRTTQ